MIYVVFLDEHPLPLVMTISHFRPTSVICLASKGRQGRRYSRTLVEWCRSQEIDAAAFEVDETDIAALIARMTREVARRGGGEVILDISASGKAMAVAAFKYASNYSGRLVYMDNREDVVHELYPEVGEQDMSGVSLTVADCLAVTGKRITNKPWRPGELSTHNRRLVEVMGNRFAALKTFIDRIRRWYMTKNNGPVQFRAGHRSIAAIDELLYALEAGGYARILRRSGYSVSIQLERRADYSRLFTGAWIEQYAGLAAITAGAEDCLVGAQILWDTDDRHSARNELDVMFTRRDNLIIVETKSGNMGRNLEAVSGQLNRLVMLREYLGDTYCDAVLILGSHFENRSSIGKKARAMGIKVFDIDDIGRLADFLRNMTTGTRIA